MQGEEDENLKAGYIALSALAKNLLETGISQLVAQIGKAFDRQTGKGDEIDIIGGLDRINDRSYQILFLNSHFAALTNSLRLILSPGVIVAETEQEMI